MSVVLTVFSLGTRVVLAYALAAIPAIGVHGIWWSIPVGWILADCFGAWYYHKVVRHGLWSSGYGSVQDTREQRHRYTSHFLL